MAPFVLFGPQHLSTLVLIVVLCVASFRGGQSRLSGALAMMGGAFFALYGLGLWYFKLSDGLDWDLDLPLQLCDLIFLFCLVAFFRPSPLLVTLSTYWGLGGTVQALLTPDVATAFPSTEYLIFFVGHAAIVLAIFFHLGRAPHPRLRGWVGVRTSFLALLAYVAVAGSLNQVFMLNYGYLRAKPAGASVLDLFGEWPLYVFAGLALAFVLFGLVALLLAVLPLKIEESHP